MGERTFDLELEPNDVRAPNFRQRLHTQRGELIKAKESEVATFKGHVAGDPDSVVRLLILPDLIQGYIRTKDEWYFIDPLSKYMRGARAANVVIFKEDQVREVASKLCGAGELADIKAKISPLQQSVSELSYGGPYALSIATEADYEYYLTYGANTNSQIQGVLNQVDGIFGNDLSIWSWISYQGVWTHSADPYSSSDPNTLLTQFKNYWNNNRKNVGRDVAHLFTGKSLSNYIGLAYVSTACYKNSAYGLSQDYPLMVKLVAHEIGHNLGANHDNEVVPPADSCSGSGPIMCTPLQTYGPDAFSSRSASDIGAYRDQYGSCMEDLTCTAQCRDDYDICAQYGCEYGDCSQCNAIYQGCLAGC